MSLALLLPMGLAALAALLLPLLIHLARRSEQRPTVFAALQWLRQKPRPRHRTRFDEWPLLLVRLLLLVMIALLLSRPVVFGTASTTPWVAVAPGVDPRQAREGAALADARWHWLAPGFPAVDTAAAGPIPSAAHAPVTSLLRELDAALPAGVPLTVLVPAELDGVDGARPRLSRPVDWRVLPDALLEAPTARETPAPAPAPAPAVSVRYAKEREASLRYLRAAHAAWHPRPSQQSDTAQDVAPITQPLTPSLRHLVWLAPGSVPESVLGWIRAGGTALIDGQALVPEAPPMVALWRSGEGEALVEGAAYGQGRLMRLTRPLTPQAMPVLLDGDLPAQLRALFESAPAPPARVLAAAHAPLQGGPSFELPPRELQSWLVLLIALLFMLERWMATGRRKRAAP